MWIDSHCHLNHRNLEKAGALEDVIARAHEAKIDAMLTINCRIAEEFEDIHTLAKAHDNIWCTIGTHPHDASKPDEQAITQEQLAEMALADPENIVGIGETGLDYYYNNSQPEDQKESLRKHLRACVETDLPVVIHARDADEDMAQILREESAGGKLRGVLHCFSSGRGLAEAGLDLGFYISFSGIVTFNKSNDLREIAKDIPLDRLLVETDAPYLAPAPHRGTTNEPAYVAYTGAKLAEIHGITPEDMAKHTTDNFFTLFNKAKLIRQNAYEP